MSRPNLQIYPILFFLALIPATSYAQSRVYPVVLNYHVNSIDHPYVSLALDYENEWLITDQSMNSILFQDQSGDDNFSVDTSNLNEDDMARRLLPQDMSWMEKLLWGRDGIFRSGKLTPEKRKSELILRRTMLTWHQRLGVTTWFLMASTVAAGQLTLNGNRRFRSWHGPLAEATIIGYAATGLLAILSPPPLVRRPGEHDTIFFHKILAFVHAAGMIALPFLANGIARRHLRGGIRTPEQIDLAKARAHQITAYITFAAFTASILTIAF
jgi:hypothetical protein